MKSVIIGGTGLIGTKLAAILQQAGHEVIAAAPSKGINALTGEGLAEALAGAQLVVDVANSPSFEDQAVLAFFETATANLIAAAKAAGVGHYVALSVVGTDRLPNSGYLRAKHAQEKLIVASGLPYSIMRATQFFEFMGAIAGSAGSGDTLHLPSQLLQPIAAADVAAALADIALGAPLNGIRDVAGPEAAPMVEFVAHWLDVQGDARTAIADPTAEYFGTTLEERSLVPQGDARIMPTRFDAWLGVREAV
jgi:uncharacterized protein YbjT (DUF2867 family)